ncbi:hypothetical protein Metig_1175 [Methanotorris igneus Kol 5]|uniref:Uncharacterized protein n=1 Tax=Methanotorris igneus (strain DSM 5666 / JCM 11834 / Kol 5) TaxID=880724 RepID=F6BE02_METIK|nr:hypothetical protein Metig_1175 [Methanotorris igneus Kol 5]
MTINLPKVLNILMVPIIMVLNASLSTLYLLLTIWEIMGFVLEFVAKNNMTFKNVKLQVLVRLCSFWQGWDYMMKRICH